MKQTVGKFVERETNVVKAIGQPGENIGQLAPPGSFVRSDELIIAAADLFVKSNVGRTAQAPALGVFVKNATDEERIISHVGTKQECLLGCGAGQRDQHIGNVFVRAMVDLARALQLVRAGKSFKQRSDIIAKFAVANAGLLQNVSGENVEIKLGRDVEMPRVGKNGLDQPRMIENRVARFRITQEIDQ